MPVTSKVYWDFGAACRVIPRWRVMVMRERKEPVGQSARLSFACFSRTDRSDGRTESGVYFDDGKVFDFEYTDDSRVISRRTAIINGIFQALQIMVFLETLALSREGCRRHRWMKVRLYVQ